MRPWRKSVRRPCNELNASKTIRATVAPDVGRTAANGDHVQKILGVVATLALTACGGPASDERGPGEYTPDFKTSSAFLTRMTAAKQGSSPHGKVQIWYSSNLRDRLGNAPFSAPEGSVAIKEFDMQADGTIDGFAVMVKKPAGYDAANNDWYYEMRDAQGAVMADPPAGKTEMCITCHAAAKATDFLAGTTL